MADNGVMTNQQPADKPRRRVITPAQTLEYLADYEHAIQTQEGGAYLRSPVCIHPRSLKWRKQRDAGMLEGKQAGQTIGKPTKE